MTAVPWRRPLNARDPNEEHRVSTPLELFLDLCVVVAISASASVLRHAIAGGHVGTGILGYSIIFFGIWWAWGNYSWLASAYDSDDVRFRLMTFAVMTGVLVMAAGIPRAQGDHHDFRITVAGYVVMRLALAPMWLLAARDDPPRRSAALKYGWGIVLVQTGWVLRAVFFGDGAIGWVLIGVLAVGELAVPWIAERRTSSGTPWHPHHVAERYQLFTIIVLGEVLLAATQAISESLDAGGLSSQLAQLIIGGLLMVFSFWWFYFKTPIVDALRNATAFIFGYAHYFIFGSIGITGACLGASVDLLRTGGGHSHAVSAVMAGAIVTFAGSLALVRRSTPEEESLLRSLIPLIGIGIVAGLPIPVGTSVLCYGVILAVAAGAYIATHQPTPVSE